MRWLNGVTCTGYNADMMFLQEVDMRMNIHYLSKLLSSLGFTYKFRPKADGLNEGLVIAFNSQRFRLLEDTSVYVKDLLSCVNHPENNDVEEWLLSLKPTTIYRYFVSRQTLLQVLHLECNGEDGGRKKRIIAANIHLPSYSPETESARIAQCILCVRYLQSEKERIARSEGEPPLLLFGGDFNSEPQDDITRMMREGRLQKEGGSEYWETGFNTEGSVFESLTGFPEYTNFTRAGEGRGFNGCLDYIWAFPTLKVEKVIPLPRQELVARHGALPSKTAPSDHLPIICDVLLE